MNPLKSQFRSVVRSDLVNCEALNTYYSSASFYLASQRVEITDLLGVQD